MKRLLWLVFIAVFIALALRTFVFEGIYIASDSMLPTLQINDHFFVDKITYNFRQPQKGEIIVFKSANPNFGYDSYPPLSRAVEKKLLADSKSQLTTVLATDRPKEEGDKRRIDNLFMALTNPPSGREEDRHCKFCAAEAVERAREFLSE